MSVLPRATSLLGALVLGLCCGCSCGEGGRDLTEISRSSFPAGFLFGVGTSAYQTEGAAYQDGRGPSIWDTFTRDFPDKIADHSSGEMADELYYRYQEDVGRVKAIGFDLFRFSLSWPRIAPNGRISKGINQKGVDFYNNLINTLLANGIRPFVTLCHWDVPQALEDEYGGFLSRDIVDDFRDYVDFCFQEFGDRVKYWSTINEPRRFAKSGYSDGIWAPGRCSDYMGNCTAGDSATEPYIVVHNMHLSHAAAVKLYREKYQGTQTGKVGITAQANWVIPKFPENITSRAATSRALDFEIGWHVDPVFYGEYPKSMRRLVGKRLPKFTEAQSQMLKGSTDFVGLTYYTTKYVEEPAYFNNVNLSATTDCRCNITGEKDGVSIGIPTRVKAFPMYPEGIRELVHYSKRKYGDTPIYIIENGLVDVNNSSLPLEDALSDNLRVYYHRSHLSYLLKAIEEGANVKGYLVWSFLDDFEWARGYRMGNGLIYVDRDDGLKRYPKSSAHWFTAFLKGHNLKLPAPTPCRMQMPDDPQEKIRMYLA